MIKPTSLIFTKAQTKKGNAYTKSKAATLVGSTLGFASSAFLAKNMQVTTDYSDIEDAALRAAKELHTSKTIKALVIAGIALTAIFSGKILDTIHNKKAQKTADFKADINA